MKTISCLSHQTSGDTSEQIAMKRAKEKMGFYIHAAVYFIVNTMQMFASFFSPEPFNYWPSMMGWGFGLTIHALVVFVGTDMYCYIKQWLLEDELERIERETNES